MKWASEKNVFSFVTLQLTSHPNDGPMIIGNIERAICVVCNAMWLTGSANSLLCIARALLLLYNGEWYISWEKLGQSIILFHFIALHCIFFSSMFFFRRVARATSHSKLDMGLMWIWHGINLKIMQIGLLAGCQRAKSAFFLKFFPCSLLLLVLLFVYTSELMLMFRPSTRMKAKVHNLCAIRCSLCCVQNFSIFR